MVWTTQKSRGCVRLFLPRTSSFLPSLTLSLFSTFTLSLLPALTHSIQSPPTLSILGSLTTTTSPISNSTKPPLPQTTISPIRSTTTSYTLKSSSSTQTPAYASVTPITISSSTSVTTLYPQTSSVSLLPRSSPKTVPKIAPQHLGVPAPHLLDPERRRAKPPHPLWPHKRPSPLRTPKPTPPPPLPRTLKSPPFSKTTTKQFQNPLKLPLHNQKPPHPPLLQTPSTSPSPKTTPSSPPKSSSAPPEVPPPSPPRPKPLKRSRKRLLLPVPRTPPPLFPSTSPSFDSSVSPSPSPKSTTSPPSKASLFVPSKKTQLHPPKRPRKIPPPVPDTSSSPSRATSPTPPLKTSPSVASKTISLLPSKTTPLHLHKHLPLTPKTSMSHSSITSPSPLLTSTSSSPPPQTFLSPPLPHPPRPPPSPLLHTSHPLFEHQPFMVSWNIPDLVCNKYNVSLDTSPFKGVATPAKVPGQFLSLFYIDRLGLYPHVDLTAGKQLYGGIPQRGNLRGSMAKARADINYYIPSRTSRGLAVIDWEEWRPLWVRNWGTKSIYQTLSVSHALQRDRSLTAQQAEAQAKQQFQAAARSFMLGTLALGRSLRPNYLWGFYLFPNCYNYGWLEPGYTGRCSKEVRGQNDELIWLWEASSALYPSVYLQASLGDSRSAALMVRNRVQEALRVSALPRRSGTAPVFVYTRPVFIDQNRRFLSQEDLVSTIGESAALGASGAVVWGASADYNDKASCEALSSYLSSTLNPYITNVTAAAQLCSDFLCQRNGRCVRKHYDSDHYLHLSPGGFRITRVQSRYLVIGRPTFADLKVFSRRFTCQCYEGLTCTPRKYREIIKDLMFRVKQGLYKKAKTLKKATLDNMEQSSIAKETIKKTLKV